MTQLQIELEQTSNEELHQRTVQASQKEQQATLDLLYHLHEIERRRLHLEMGYSSLWEYTKGLGYSETQTNERISAMRLMFRAEEARMALETGTINLTQAAMAERHLRSEEKEKRIPVATEKVQELLGQVEGKTRRETEKLLLSLKPKEEQIPEKIRAVTEEITELKFPVSEEMRKAMERFWELKGRCSLAEMFSTCLISYLEKNDPAQKCPKLLVTDKVERVIPKKSGTFGHSGFFRNPSRSTFSRKGKKSRYISTAVREGVRRRAEEQCEYVDPITHRRCESKYLLQYDHMKPYAWGGSSNLRNIRILCRNHNLYLAEKKLGKGLARQATETG